MKLRLRFSCFFIGGLLCFIVYMGLFIGLLLEYVFPVLEEIQSFSNEIYSKGKYIEGLIDDLRLSLHIENTKAKIPLSEETFDLIPFLQELTADITNMPNAENYNLDFSN